MLDGNIPDNHICAMNTLEHHLRTTGEKQADFAARIGVRQGTVSKLVRGEVTPSLALAGRIDLATGGAVPMSAWIKPEFEAGAISSPPGAGASSSLPSNTDGGRCGLDDPSNRNLQPNE